MKRADTGYKVAIMALKTQGEVSSKYNKHFNSDEFKNEKTKNKSQKSYFQQFEFSNYQDFKSLIKSSFDQHASIKLKYLKSYHSNFYQNIGNRDISTLLY